MIHAIFESRNFTFEAFAPDQYRAQQLMEALFKVHCEQYPTADPDYFTIDDVIYRNVDIGCAYRDGDEVVRTQITPLEVWSGIGEKS